MRRALASLCVAALLAACGGGGGGGGAGSGGGGGTGGTPPPAITRGEAATFLRQASFGPTRAEIDRVVAGGYAAWIDQQLARPASLQAPALRALGRAPTQDDRLDLWFRHAVQGEDQLRLRVAFALSQIMVVSERSALNQFPTALAAYYDILNQNAFGNFRELLEQVTLSPAMGVYLSHLGNQKPNPALNIRPDENYAREVMQLFTIGLVELAPDGSIRRDAQGQPIPTYDQAVIESFARVFTGWMFAGSASFLQPSFNFDEPMQPFQNFHDTDAKTLLRGTTLPANQGARADLEAALDNLFAHPNVGPFISKQLIQRLTSSNPSPAYVARIAARFDDNGRGVRGDLAAVVRAILLDDEARRPAASAAGKLTEPLLRLTALWRAFDGRSASGRYRLNNADVLVGQGPLRSPSVFNFYRPDFAPPGEMRSAGLVAPEMEITNEATVAYMANLLAFGTFGANANTNPGSDGIVIDTRDEEALAGNAPQLVDRVADELTGGAISATLRNEAIAMVERLPASAAAARVAEAIHAIVTAPEYVVVH
jgi:uncharacterized protein (DUF1800 family)